MGQKIELEVRIARPRDRVWQGLVTDIGVWWKGQNNEPLAFVLEARPGGRLFRDLGADAGHFWGHVQVIKPPGLLEIVGPLFFSSAVLSHLSFRLSDDAGGTRLAFTHSYNGEVGDDFATHANQGWQNALVKGLKHHVEQH